MTMPDPELFPGAVEPTARGLTQAQQKLYQAIARMWFMGSNFNARKVVKRIKALAIDFGDAGARPDHIPVAVENWKAMYPPSRDKPKGLTCNPDVILKHWSDIKPTLDQLLDLQLGGWTATLPELRGLEHLHPSEVRYVLLTVLGKSLPRELMNVGRDRWRALDRAYGPMGKRADLRTVVKRLREHPPLKLYVG
jgi:hypothetical protein